MKAPLTSSTIAKSLTSLSVAPFLHLKSSMNVVVVVISLFDVNKNRKEYSTSLFNVSNFASSIFNRSLYDFNKFSRVKTPKLVEELPTIFLASSSNVASLCSIFLNSSNVDVVGVLGIMDLLISLLAFSIRD